ncbi:hypothetical protein FRX31_013904 [Thalictrum thalictroides]|uniref:Uncharacterized protein n=1 Tax=Thalictrum thalictroides TaxID=46969 RepID=A0A7J6WGQ7_THATH|nr:hypothetical protein FRX31_013904 [Thalictrum thalictroides]
MNGGPLSSKKEETLPMTKSPLTLFIVMEPEVLLVADGVGKVTVSSSAHAGLSRSKLEYQPNPYRGLSKDALKNELRKYVKRERYWQGMLKSLEVEMENVIRKQEEYRERCLEDGPDAAERRPGSGFPTGRGAGYGHLEAHHDPQATPARPGKATRLGVRGSIVPAASRTEYSSFLKAGISALESYTGNNERGFTRGFPFITSFTTREPRPHQSKWWNAPLSKRGASAPLSKRYDSDGSRGDSGRNQSWICGKAEPPEVPDGGGSVTASSSAQPAAEPAQHPTNPYQDLSKEERKEQLRKTVKQLRYWRGKLESSEVDMRMALRKDEEYRNQKLEHLRKMEESGYFE